MVATPPRPAAAPAPPTESFHSPAAPAAAPLRRLTPDEIAFYREHGYVVIPGVFPAAEMDAMDQEIDRLITVPGNEAGGQHQGWVFAVARRSELARSLAEDERLLALVEDVVQPGLAIHSTKLVNKNPHSADICQWHQDEAYYTNPNDAATNAKTRMSVWVPLQDTDERNGCLWIVPGSHTWGLEPYTLVDWGTCRKKIDRDQYADEHAIPVPVSAGTVVLFDGWAWHESKNNETDHTRRAFIVSYQEATVQKGAGEQWKILRPA